MPFFPKLAALGLCGATVACASPVPFVTFDNDTATTFPFVAEMDDVMGSQSWGNWTQQNGVGVLSGVVTIVDRPAVSIPHCSLGLGVYQGGCPAIKGSAFVNSLIRIRQGCR